MELSKNTVLITGGTSGIGRALAERLHELGNQVIVAGRRQSLLDEISKAHPGIRGFAIDLGDKEASRSFTAEVERQCPNLNVLINNAGIMKAEDLTASTLDLSLSDETIQSNLVSVLHVTAGLLPILKRQAHSVIITTTSALAFVPLAKYPTYCGAKAFLHSWIQSLRFQLRHTSVEVLELIPTYVQTEIQESQQASDPRAMSLDEFIGKTLELMAEPPLTGGELLIPPGDKLRWAERRGNYDEVFAEVNSH